VICSYGGPWNHATVRDTASSLPGWLVHGAGTRRYPVRYWGRASTDVSRGCSSMAEPQPSKLVMRVRFPSSALLNSRRYQALFECSIARCLGSATTCSMRCAMGMRSWSPGATASQA
jgi:hypothetical protein